jgi:hypothetical protein
LADKVFTKSEQMQDVELNSDISFFFPNFETAVLAIKDKANP